MPFCACNTAILIRAPMDYKPHADTVPLQAQPYEEHEAAKVSKLCCILWRLQLVHYFWHSALIILLNRISYHS
jgi:hypothetical protein